MRIVIVGTGLTGANAAIALREAGYEDELLLLGDEPGLPFGRPPLSKTYMRDEEDLTGSMPRPGDWYDAHGVVLRTDAPVERADPPNGRVVLANGDEIVCDKVCIATGCRPRRPRIPGIDLDGVFALRTKADCDAIKSAAKDPEAKAAVIGMSFIGSEVAASLRGLGVDVTAIFPGAGPLASVFGDVVANRMAEIHREEGVELIANDRVVAFGGAGRVEHVITEGGRTVECTMAVLGLGVEPNVETLKGSDVAIGDGVDVDGNCRTNVENIFAAGDVANHAHPIFGRIRVEHYNNAEKQGRYVGTSMLDATKPYDYIYSFWSDQYEHKLEYVGIASESDEFIVRGDPLREPFLGFYLKGGVLRAAVGLDRGGDPEAEPDCELAVCVRLIRAGAHVDRNLLTDDGVELRDLLTSA